MAGQQFFDVLTMGSIGAKGPTNAVRIAADAAGNLKTSVKGAPFSPIGAGGTASSLLSRSASVLGTADFAAIFDDLDGPLASNWQVLGTWALSGAKGPGVATVISLNDQVLIRQTACIVANPAVTPWHIAGRMQLINPLGGTDIKGMQLVAIGSGNPDVDSVFVGARAAVSTTKFTFSLVKASAFTNVQSTVSVDANWHKFELWFNGTQVFGSVDNETPVLVGAAANCPAVAVQERHGCDLGAGSGVDTAFDYFYVAAARTAS